MLLENSSEHIVVQERYAWGALGRCHLNIQIVCKYCLDITALICDRRIFQKARQPHVRIVFRQKIYLGVQPFDCHAVDYFGEI